MALAWILLHPDDFIGHKCCMLGCWGDKDIQNVHPCRRLLVNCTAASGKKSICQLCGWQKFVLLDVVLVLSQLSCKHDPFDMRINGQKECWLKKNCFHRFLNLHSWFLEFLCKVQRSGKKGFAQCWVRDSLSGADPGSGEGWWGRRSVWLNWSSCAAAI